MINIFYDYIQYINDGNILENILHNRSDPKMLKISQAGLVSRRKPACNTDTLCCCTY